MLETVLPLFTAVTKDLSARIFYLLHQQSIAPLSSIFLWPAIAEDEDMETISGGSCRQLARWLHSIWRSCSAIPNGENIMSSEMIILNMLTPAQFHERFVTHLGWIDEPMVSPSPEKSSPTLTVFKVPADFCHQSGLARFSKYENALLYKYYS